MFAEAMTTIARSVTLFLTRVNAVCSRQRAFDGTFMKGERLPVN
jgi:hypothetical protein